MRMFVSGYGECDRSDFNGTLEDAIKEATRRATREASIIAEAQIKSLEVPSVGGYEIIESKVKFDGDEDCPAVRVKMIIEVKGTAFFSRNV